MPRVRLLLLYLFSQIVPLQTINKKALSLFSHCSGLWLRAIAGRQRKMWKKHRKRRRRNKQFIFCNKTQSKMLDRMVTMEYKTRKYYPDDPLQQFQERNYCGLKQYPGLAYLKQHQQKSREPSSSDPLAQQIHDSFGVNRYNPWIGTHDNAKESLQWGRDQLPGGDL